MAHLCGYGFEQEVVGESHYISQLKKAFRSGKISKNGKRSYVIVRLVLEDNNKYDKNAVAVMSDFGKVGHLSRADAILYRRIYGSVKTHTADAVIVTRHGDKFGVWLDITLDDDCDDFKENKQSLPKANNINTPIQRPIILDPPKPAPPPKPWKDQSTSQKIGTILALAFLFGVFYVVYLIVAWFFRLIF